MVLLHLVNGYYDITQVVPLGLRPGLEVILILIIKTLEVLKPKQFELYEKFALRSETCLTETCYSDFCFDHNLFPGCFAQFYIQIRYVAVDQSLSYPAELSFVKAGKI